MGNFFREGTEVEIGIGSLSLMTRLSRVLVTQYKPGTELNVLVRRSQAFIDETDDKALAESILGELDDELRKLEERAFLAGVRSDEPQGIFTSTAYERRKAVLSIDAVIDLVYSIQPAHRQHAIFIANSNDYRDLRQLKDANGRFAMQDAMTRLDDPMLLGYPIHFSEFVPRFHLAFGNMIEGYLSTNNGKTKIVRDPFTRKPLVQFQATRAVGGAPQDATAIKILEFTHDERGEVSREPEMVGGSSAAVSAPLQDEGGTET